MSEFWLTGSVSNNMPIKFLIALLMAYSSALHADSSDRQSVSLYKAILAGSDDKADYIWKLNAAKSDLDSDGVRTLDYASLLSEMDRLFSDDFKEVLKVAGRVCASEILDLGYFENDVSVRLFYQCIAYESERKARYQGGYIWAVSSWLKDHFYVRDESSTISLKLKSGWAETALLRYAAMLQYSEATK